MNAGKLRNKPCPCGSGKKFKKCCLGLTRKQLQDKADEAEAQLLKTIESSLPDIFAESDAGALEEKVKSVLVKGQNVGKTETMLDAMKDAASGESIIYIPPVDPAALTDVAKVVQDIQSVRKEDVVTTIDSLIP